MSPGVGPLSFAQQRLWVLDRLRPNDSAYNVTHLLYLSGPAELTALERTVNEIRRRHEVLRANFVMQEDEPVQIIAPYRPVPLPLVDLSAVAEDARERLCRETIESSAQPPFNLASDPLTRVALVRMTPETHVLVWTLHHIISDGWSAPILVQEFADLYAAFSQGKPSPLADLPMQYSDYTRWQRERLQGPVLEKLLAYWTRYLEDGATALELPADRPRRPDRLPTARRLTRSVPPELRQSLQSLARGRQSTLFMVLLTALQILLHRLSAQPHVTIGVPVAGRTRLEVEPLIGMFVNTLPIRTTFSDADTFGTVLTRVRAAMLDALTFQELPFEKIVEALRPSRSLTQTPLFQVMLNAFLVDNPPRRAGALTIESHVLPAHESKFDLSVYLLQQRDALHLEVRYAAELFDDDRMREMLEQFFLLLEQAVVDPGAPIASYTLVSDHARSLVPDPTLPMTQPDFVPAPDLFRASAATFPQHRAVVKGDAAWSYGELARSSEAIARTLVARGLRGKVVGVMAPRCFGLIASVLGVSMSGGVLMPIDRRLPAARQRVMLTEARAACMLYVGPPREQDQWLRDVPGLVTIDVPATSGLNQSDADVALPAIAADDPAYVFFTSGTTGIPKGVLGRHGSLSHFLAWQRTAFDVGPHDRCAQLTNLSFEVFLRDVFLPLTTGATLYLPDESGDLASGKVMSWLDRHGITLFHAVPAVADTWLETDSATPRHLRLAFFGGEPLSDASVRRWRERLPPNGRIVNLYGPAETTLAKSFFVISGEPAFGIQPLGTTLPDTQALVLNGRGQVCGVGEPGEIVIRTPFRALGYINAPDEQRKRFVRNPFTGDPDDLLYLTGDRGRYRPDGLLEFLGRVDDEVKIRGVRVEPAEVSAVLSRHPRIRGCFVTAVRNLQDEHVLVAYVVAPGGDRDLRNDLRAYLGEHLPSVMVPSVFVSLDALPISSNGKVDRRALPPFDVSTADDDGTVVRPRTPAEQSLHDIWCRLLNHREIDVRRSFFDLGGHSLTATRLVSHIEREFHVQIPLDTVFAKPTIAELAVYVLEQRVLGSSRDTIDQLLADVESEEEGAADNEAGLA